MSSTCSHDSPSKAKDREPIFIIHTIMFQRSQAKYGKWAWGRQEFPGPGRERACRQKEDNLAHQQGELRQGNPLSLSPDPGWSLECLGLTQEESVPGRGRAGMPLGSVSTEPLKQLQMGILAERPKAPVPRHLGAASLLQADIGQCTGSSESRSTGDTNCCIRH